MAAKIYYNLTLLDIKNTANSLEKSLLFKHTLNQFYQSMTAFQLISILLFSLLLLVTY